jgi:multiple sugar transport system substrate-binding protein
MRPEPESGFFAETVSRRTILRLLGVGGASLAAVACTNTDEPASTGPTLVKKGKFDIPASGAKLPTGKVTLRWMDSGDAKAYFFKDFFPAYSKKHANIKVQYDGSNWNNIQQVITLGMRNGSAPDVFQVPPNIPVPEAVKNGWLGVIDDIVPHWDEVKSRFPAGTFANGVTDFDGKTYGVPFTSNARFNNLLLFNADYTKKADYDLANKVLSWDELRAVAKKCTKQGNGKYYGIIFGLTQQGQLSGPVSDLAQMSGLHGGSDAGNGINSGINWKTGEFNYTDDLNVAAIELMLAMKSDGSIFPGSASIDAPGARARMPQGVAAMMFQGPWNIPAWRQDNPSFNLGLNIPPQQDPKKQIWPLIYGPGGSNTWYISSNTKVGPVIGDIFSYMASDDGQTQWAEHDGAGDPPAFADALKKASLDKLQLKALELGNKYTLIRPDPAVRNPDVSKAYEAAVPVQPNFSDTLVGLYTGQIKKSVPKAMKDLQDRSNKAMDKAIATAKQRGAKVSRSDWVFSDWDPAKPYTKLYQK